jgi:acyl-CoA hydrolase
VTETRDDDGRGERRAADSRARMSILVEPADANSLGNMAGGRVVHLMDINAAVAAARHSGKIAVTAQMDEIVFTAPVPVGEIVVVESTVNFAGHTSMEVGTNVYVENRQTGHRTRCVSAHMTFVAMNDEMKPVAIPRLVAETPDEQRRYREAEQRREERLQRRDARRSGDCP